VSQHTRPAVGVAVIIRDGARILMGLRTAGHGAGTWQFPGGHLTTTKTGPAEAPPLLTEGWEEWAAGTDQGFMFTTAAGQLVVNPIWGDAERAFVYWSAAKEAEGQGDLPSIGTCCRLDAQQGPEAFVNPAEPLGRTPVLWLWYVPQILNAERVRCWADTEIIEGVLVPRVWPCGSGLTLSLRSEGT
jgi:hypothetical protein